MRFEVTLTYAYKSVIQNFEAKTKEDAIRKAVKKFGDTPARFAKEIKRD
jgi:hypothetical protein